MKLQEIKHLVGADTISRKENVITIRKSFYYRFERSTQTFVDMVKKYFPQATILDCGENYAPFRGGASIANSSHWFVKFQL